MKFFVKEAAEHYCSVINRDIPKLDTVLLHLNWSNIRQKYFSKIPTGKRVELWAKSIKDFEKILDVISPARHPQKSSQHVRACVEGNGAICSKNRKNCPISWGQPQY